MLDHLQDGPATPNGSGERSGKDSSRNKGSSEGPLIVSFEHADSSQIDKLGAKGAKLAEDFQGLRQNPPSAQDAISVPDGFILSTDVWRAYQEGGGRLPHELFDRICLELFRLERRQGRIFGDVSGKWPLFVAVRGGAPVSLPGVLGTVLNVGFNDDVAKALIAAGEDKSFVLTTYLSTIRMYGEVVLEIPYQFFYEILQCFHVGDEGTLSVPLLYRLVGAFKGVLEDSHHPHFSPGFPTDLGEQLRNVIEAIMGSWMSLAAVEARSSREPKVPDDMGTAVVIQAMVFGNRDDRNCFSGVCFTRNQRTGADVPVIEWARKVQCDKIVSGKLRKQLLRTADLKDQFPDIYESLMMVRDRGELKAKRPLDIEFTVENRKLYILQRRPLRMTFNATVRSMWDLVDEGKTSVQQASMIINNALEQPEQELREGFHDFEVLARGEPVTNSAESGILTFGTEAALELAWQGQDVILLRMRPYGETDVAINHPHVRGIIRCDGHTTGHEAVSAVAYSKPYIINMVDVDGKPLIVSQGDQTVMNGDSRVARYLGKRVFVDCERGILGYTEATDFLVDRRGRKKLYIDWEYLRRQFEGDGYDGLDYKTLLDLHYQWELELEGYQALEKRLREKDDPQDSEDELLKAFSTYLAYVPQRDRLRTLHLKEVRAADFVIGDPLKYRGKHLGREVLKIMHALMLATTWRTHWLHEIMVSQARARGETENDVIRDIFLKNRTMSMLRSFEKEGFHVMKTSKHYYLILASNFEYNQDLDMLQVSPETLDFGEKEALARSFLSYVESIDPKLSAEIRIVQGEPPLGQGHARIISVGLSIPDEAFDLTCRYLRTFLDAGQSVTIEALDERIPSEGSVHLYELDPFFAPYPDFSITREAADAGPTGDFLLSFGECSFGEIDGAVYGQEGYEKLTADVKRFEQFIKERGGPVAVRPWQFEVDPYRRHSVIAAVGIRFSNEDIQGVIEMLRAFLAPSS
jgi:phosphoenolpyruvate synthase/pyruvate phosphate dikinase